MDISLETAPRSVKEAVDSTAEEEVVETATSVEELATLPRNAPANVRNAVEDTEAVSSYLLLLL